MKYTKNDQYEILTAQGFKDFKGIRKLTKPGYCKILLSGGQSLRTSTNHRIALPDGSFKEVAELQIGQEVKGQSTNTVVKDLQIFRDPIELYDIVQSKDHTYFTNGILSHNCDCNFLSSGDTFFEPDDMTFYEKTYAKDPVERRGVGQNLWIWEYPDYAKSYVLSADVARGDGSDFSAFHVWDAESMTQVAEYKGQLSPKEFGDVLVSIATEYNNALLVCENANIGWSTIEEIIARGYANLFYSDSSIQSNAETYNRKAETGKLTAGFTTSVRTRPLLLTVFWDYIRQRSVIIRSKRLLLEMRTFVWTNGKAQAATGYHDDLVMSAGTGMYVRDTALKLRQEGLALSRASLSGFNKYNQRKPVVSPNTPFNNPYEIRNQYGQTEDIRWVLGK